MVNTIQTTIEENNIDAELKLDAKTHKKKKRIDTRSIGIVAYGTNSIYKSVFENTDIHIPIGRRQAGEAITQWFRARGKEVDQILIGHEHGDHLNKCHYQCILTFKEKVRIWVTPFQSHDGQVLYMFQETRDPKALEHYCKKGNDWLIHKEPTQEQEAESTNQPFHLPRAGKRSRQLPLPEESSSDLNEYFGEEPRKKPPRPNPYQMNLQSGPLSREEMLSNIKKLDPRGYHLSHSNILKAVERECSSDLPPFEWRWPSHADTLPNQSEIQPIKQWFQEWCTPEALPRRQALVLYGAVNLGKTTFCQSLVPHKDYSVVFSNSFTLTALRRDPRLLILDDMQYPHPSNAESWKQLLSGQPTALRDAYLNVEWPHRVPCILLTNNLAILQRLLSDPAFAGRVFAVEVTSYLGPPGTQPALSTSKRFLQPSTLEEIQRRQARFQSTRDRSRDHSREHSISTCRSSQSPPKVQMNLLQNPRENPLLTKRLLAQERLSNKQEAAILRLEAQVDLLQQRTPTMQQRRLLQQGRASTTLPFRRLAKTID